MLGNFNSYNCEQNVFYLFNFYFTTDWNTSHIKTKGKHACNNFFHHILVSVSSKHCLAELRITLPGLLLNDKLPSRQFQTLFGTDRLGENE